MAGCAALIVAMGLPSYHSPERPESFIGRGGRLDVLALLGVLADHDDEHLGQLGRLCR